MEHNYSNPHALASIALGGADEPHRIVWIQSKTRGQGFAKDLMKDICAAADQDHRDLAVSLVQVEPWVSRERLEVFFENFGFVRSKDDRFEFIRPKVELLEDETKDKSKGKK